MTGRARPLALAAALFGLSSIHAIPTPAGAAEGDPSKAGAYCKLPEPGQKPVCLEPAQAKYEDFFSGVEEGAPSAEATARLAADLDARGDDAYLALSSFAYGYWQLARRAAENEEVDPALATQLEAWNDLLSDAYTNAEGDAAFQQAVREAAQDLDERTPVEGFQCLDDAGVRTTCRPAAALLSRVDGLDAQLGVRGAVRRVLERLFGTDAS